MSSEGHAVAGCYNGRTMDAMPKATLPPRMRRLESLQELMPERIQNILLVSSLYDSFILERDGQLTELFLSEFLDLNLRHTPGLRHVSSGREALQALEEGRFNLVITSLNVTDMNALELAREVKARTEDVPVILLGYDSRELKDFVSRHDVSDIERVFLYQGDVRIFLAIVKYMEDRLNLEHDTAAGVQAVILIEDSIRYYSSFLPLIYAELFRHSHSVISEGVNLTHKILRMRARPKILLCTSFEEAWEYFSRYSDVILGVISDIEFPHSGKLQPDAGAEFARKVREAWPDIPVLLQSSRPENRVLAEAAGACFVLKNSPTLLNDLREFMVDNFAFGDFVFRLPDGTEVDRAHSLRSLLEKLRTVPAECIGYHGERNHFSNWLKARTEFALAEKLRPRKVSDFATLEDIRRNLIESIEEYRRERQSGVISDYDPDTFDPQHGFARIGGGSLGGKARGLAFVRYLLYNYPVDRLFDGVVISVPPAVVLGTDVFDRFLDDNDLRDFALHCDDDHELTARFHSAGFPQDVRDHLASFLEGVTTPLAVRSSSLLEDSQYQPFTGVYETYMLPNAEADPAVRLERLIAAIKQVYLSTFSSHAKTYIRATPYRLEEEKMAVIVMKVVGERHGQRFYPDFSGVARSYNFYPTPPLSSDDGVASVALGMGRMVVEGGAALQFSPRFPRHVLQLSSARDMLDACQRTFWALSLEEEGDACTFREREYGLDAAEEDGTLGRLGSVYSPENDAIYDGISRSGVRLVSFAPILKHGVFPLAQILEILLELGSWGMNSPVEIEFAVNLSVPAGEPTHFAMLQMRPLALARETEALELGDPPRDTLVCRSDNVLGNGRVEVFDLLVVDAGSYRREESRAVADAVARINARLVREARAYVLIGVGRWGSKDPWLGIPVTWDQISGARTIVEASFRDFQVAPSQGTHFFQNLTSFNVGYFTVGQSPACFVDWRWLADQPAVVEEGPVRLLSFDQPLVVKMNGRLGEGLISRPGKGESGSSGNR